METLKSSIAAKITAAILLIVCTVSTASSLLVMAAMDTAGIYQKTKGELLKEKYADVCEDYSITALAGHDDDFNMEELSKTNFRFGVIKSDKYKAWDADHLPEMNEYTAGNFKEPLDAQNIHIFECVLTNDTEFAYGKNIWDSFYIVQHKNTEYEDVEHTWEKCLYDTDTRSFYLLSGNKLYLLRYGSIYIQENEEISIDCFNNEFVITKKHETGNQEYHWDDTCKNGSLITENGTVVPMREIRIVDRPGLLKQGRISKEIVDSFDEDTIFSRKEKKPENRYYTVISAVQEPLVKAASFNESDLFAQTKMLVDFAYKMRYPVLAVLLFSLAGMLVCFSFLMAAAGHKKGQKEICRGLLDKLPLDLYFAGTAIVDTLLAGLILVYIRRPYSPGFLSYCVCSACAGITGMILAILFCMSFAVRVKLGKWWKDTCIYWIGKKCVKILSSCVRFFIYIIRCFRKSVTLLGKAWMILGALAFVEYTGLFAAGSTGASGTFWLLEKMVLYPLIILLLLQMRELQKGAERIANGELDFKIPTGRMFWETKKHAEYLNAIGTGMNHAVNERMKSEHFKTELITNVSHDIKTPLTSIINYVDLLEKEQIDHPKVREYLEVLHRQSARLKKLIEDLMEASKASTGSLSVVMEECDAGVMLVQTVGEFEEKLMENQIELQIKKTEEHLFIEADHRHLWRVFDNLMNNICKYAQPLTRAYVNLDRDGQRALITFRNISRCQLNISSEELMERFVRGDSSRNTEGSGLGISIAKSLTELMGGTFSLVVDGDLFKVILEFPLYEMANADLQEDYFRKQKEVANFQNDGTQYHHKKRSVLSEAASGIRSAGIYAAGFGRSAADKTGRMAKRAGRFVQNLKLAAEQTKAEEAYGNRNASGAYDTEKEQKNG